MKYRLFQQNLKDAGSYTKNIIFNKKSSTYVGGFLWCALQHTIKKSPDYKCQSFPFLGICILFTQRELFHSYLLNI